MKKFTGFITILLFSTILTAQIAEVTNVTASQRTDGSKIVDIYYDLSDDITFSTFTVTVEISMDGGTIFSPTSYVTGDNGNGIVAGIGKQIEWNLGAEYPGMFNNQTVIRVVATGRFFIVPFDFVLVVTGDFTYGGGSDIRNIPYDYEMMTYEVTCADYTTFVLDAMEASQITFDGNWVRGYYAGDEQYEPGEYNLLATWESHISWNGTTFIVEEGFGDHPVTGVTWFGANKFAEYYALRLPTEEEWEKAARGITGFSYPWGNEIDSSRANYRLSGDPWDAGDNWEIIATTPVGFYNGQLYNSFQTTNSPSPYGAYDMVGNVNEWTSSWFENNNNRHVYRSGTYRWNSWDILTYHRWDWNSNDYSRETGFRCVRTISSARADFLLNNKTAKSKAKSNK
ncbi:MAG: SUMF1/EgtB/PvdO family nonheme iron enzyme [Candidatus Marinimicrobia bacterium]|nr:SUMF1/EgtB/PvdO family nonheme iron enzyme [Candidatus Neomarinimicrobiota bacterium]